MVDLKAYFLYNGGMGKDYRIALFLENSRHYGRELTQGIAQYSRLFGPWSYYYEDLFYYSSKRKSSVPFLKKWGVDGIIARDFKGIVSLLELGVPIISVKNLGNLEHAIQVVTDDRAVGEVAFEHYFNRGFKNLAYCGFSNMPWSRVREESFVACAASADLSVECFDSSATGRMLRRGHEYSKIASWLKKLPKPVGVFCCNDDRGYDIIESCKLANYDVPNEVAVLGVDNDPQVCNVCNPLLSSVSLGIEKAGFQAAEILHRLIEKKRVDVDEIAVSPISVVVRRSADVFAIVDDEVARAVSFIYNNAPDNISVDDVVEATTLSRRAIEIRFSKTINHTIADEIRRVRILNSKTFLRETDFSVSHISEIAGFSSTPYFSAVFSKVTGLSPLGYRKKCRMR